MRCGKVPRQVLVQWLAESRGRERGKGLNAALSHRSELWRLHGEYEQHDALGNVYREPGSM